jgi:hypothetical protein
MGNQIAIDFSQVRFNGADYDRDRDNLRLGKQAADVFNLMKDGQWRTLQEIEAATKHPPASVSAQLRHFRKERFGGHEVNRKHEGNGLYRYQLIVNNG